MQSYIGCRQLALRREVENEVEDMGGFRVD